MNEESLFHAALERSSPAERSTFLDAACEGDDRLREAVEALLAAHEASGPFLDAPAVADQAIGLGADRAVRPFAAPDVLIAGRYLLQEKIGEGGWARSGWPGRPSRSGGGWR